MKVKLSSLTEFQCFLDGRGKEKKLVENGRVLSVNAKGKVSYKKVKGDPEVEPKPCSISLFGAGHRRHPDVLIQIGDGNILRPKKGRR